MRADPDEHGGEHGEGPGGGSTPPRRVPQLLLDRTFGSYFLGQTVATIAVWIHNVAAAVLVWELTRSTVLVAAITIGQFVPQLILTPWSGARADRRDRRNQLVAGTIVTAIGSGLIALWSATLGLSGTSGAYAVIAAAVVVGTGFSISGPASQALLPSLVERRELATAIAIASVPMTIARAVGPALGALLITVGGTTLTFTVTAILHTTYAAVMYRRGRPAPPPSDGRDLRIRAAVRHVLDDRPMLYLLVGVTTVGLGVDPVITLAPAFADALNGAGDVVGYLASAFGLGAGAGFAIQPLARRRLGVERSATTGLLILAIGLAPLGYVPTVAAGVAVMLVAGVGMTLSLTAFTTAIQQRAPDQLRGRVMALWSIAFLGSRPLAALLSGAISAARDEASALLAAVAIILIGAVLSRPSLTRER
jgi:MFS family permease